MRKITNLLLIFGIVLSFTLSGCGTSSSVDPTLTSSSPITLEATFTPLPSTPSRILPTSTLTPISQGKTIIVSSANDNGPYTLRQAMRDAKTGDTITFDPKVFPPENPATIFLKNEDEDSALPNLNQGGITIDASNAGVILDGREAREEWTRCLIIRSDGNVVRGLQIINFLGSGISLEDDAQNNVIGGDRAIGMGPLGQGNLLSSNYVGIDLQEANTSYNTIMGNIIGTDVDGLADLGNHETGIYVSNGASHNTIGPGNIIAYNNEGIQVNKPNSLGNIITQNSIYKNDLIGILLNSEGNAYSSPPSIIGFDLSNGSIAVSSCANCEVEIFSDDSDQGKIYEGRGKANAAGILNFEKGTSLNGPHLTATTTDMDGNTSGFSLPTIGAGKPASDLLRSKLLQDGNNLPLIELETKQSRELQDNWMGTFTGGPLWQPLAEPELYPQGVLDTKYILEMGFKRFRLIINSLDWDKVVWNKSEFSIDPSQDEFITTLANNGVKLTFVLSFWDIAYKAEGGEIPIPRFKTEEEIERYLDYVKFIVHHFKDRVEYYEIWNEPNLTGTIQWIEAKDYINLVRRAVPVIRQEYPAAKIQVGGTTSLKDKDSQTYLFKIINSDIMPLVDVISWHPMYGQSPEYEGHKQYYYDYPSLVQKIKDASSAHGFTGEYKADEIHWPTPAQPEPPWPTYSNIQSVKYLTRSIVMHRGLDLTVTQLLLVGNMQLHHTNQYLSTIMAGAKPINLPLEIQSEAANITSYSFSLSNGDKLVTIWNDNIAVDYDPGILSTLIIQNFAGWNATGMDVLNGFGQELISTSEDSNLVIHDFVLKDYPIIIRLSK